MLKPKKQYGLIFNRRLFLLSAIKLVTFTFVINRLYNLQIKQTEKYKKLADNNRVNLSFIVPSRGLIFDRNNKLLADNEEQYQLIFKGYSIKDKLKALEKVFNYVKLSEIKKQDLKKQITEKKSRLLVKQNMSWTLSLLKLVNFLN